MTTAQAPSSSSNGAGGSSTGSLPAPRTPEDKLSRATLGVEMQPAGAFGDGASGPATPSEGGWGDDAWGGDDGWELGVRGPREAGGLAGAPATGAPPPRPRSPGGGRSASAGGTRDGDSPLARAGEEPDVGAGRAPAADTPPALWVVVVKNLSLIATWYVLSTSLSMWNKLLVGKDHGAFGGTPFPAPFLMSSVQFLTQYGMCALFLATGAVRRKAQGGRMPWREWSLKILPNGLATGLDIGLSNYSLVFIPLSFYVMCKSSTPLFLLACAFAWGLERPSWDLAAVVAVICAGLTLLVAGEGVTFNLVGFLLVMSASALAGVRWTITQVLLHGHQGAASQGAEASGSPGDGAKGAASRGGPADADGSSARLRSEEGDDDDGGDGDDGEEVALVGGRRRRAGARDGRGRADDPRSHGGPVEVLLALTPVMASCLGVLSLAVERPWNVLPGSPYFSSPLHCLITMGFILSGACIAFFMVWTEFALIESTSALTFMVAGTFKEIVTVGAAVVFLHETFTFVNALGLLVLIVGVGLFNWYKYKRLRETLAAEASPAREGDDPARLGAPFPSSDPELGLLAAEPHAARQSRRAHLPFAPYDVSALIANHEEALLGSPASAAADAPWRHPHTHAHLDPDDDLVVHSTSRGALGASVSPRAGLGASAGLPSGRSSPRSAKHGDRAVSPRGAGFASARPPVRASTAPPRAPSPETGPIAPPDASAPRPGAPRDASTWGSGGTPTQARGVSLDAASPKAGAPRAAGALSLGATPRASAHRPVAGALKAPALDAEAAAAVRQAARLAVKAGKRSDSPPAADVPDLTSFLGADVAEGGRAGATRPGLGAVRPGSLRSGPPGPSRS